MRKGKLLNSNILNAIGKMGHMDTITIGDCGLPIPEGPERIDIALYRGVPSFIETLDMVLTELEVEEVVLAEEIKTENPDMYNQILSRIDESRISFVTHMAFKKRTEKSKAVIRTGENTPYANIILQSGVVF